MSDTGFFAVHRGVWDHPSFAAEPFTEREAWMWLISTAVWKPTKVRSGRKTIELQRGQLVFSERFLAEKWKWSKSAVRRFLKRTTDDHMIELLADREATLITICNYDKYQTPRTTGEPQTEPPANREPDQRRTNNQITNNQRKQETRVNALSPEWRLWFDTFWQEWPNKVGKPAALKAIIAAEKRGADLDAIIAGVQRYIREKPPDRQWLNPATFFNQNRWEDQPAKVQNGKTNPFDAAFESVLDKLNSGFSGPPPEERFRTGTGEDATRLLAYRGSK